MQTLTFARRIFLTAALAATAGPVYSQGASDLAGVATAAQAFYAALSQRDLAAMERVWAVAGPVFLINPRDKTPTIGWNAVKENWNSAFSFWTDLKVTPHDMQVRVNGDSAAVTNTALVEGHTKDGKAASFTALNTQVFERKGGAWLLVSHHSSRALD